MIMKKTFALALGLTLCAPLNSASAEEYIYGSFISSRAPANQIGFPKYFEGVEKDSGGNIKWRMEAGGSLVSGRGSLAGIRDRTVDGGMIISTFTRKELKNNNIIADMQFSSQDTIAVVGASTEMILLHCPQCIEDHKASNAVFLAGLGLTPNVLYCTSDVSSLADLEGKKIRATGAPTRWVTAMGAIATPMSAPEAVEALQRGVVDCVLGPMQWLKTYGYMDSVKSIIDYPMGVSRGHFTFVMNRDSWSKLSLENKKIMLDHIPAMMARTTITGYIKDDQSALEIALSKGIKVSKGGPEFAELQAEHIKSEEAVLPEKLAELGAGDVEATMATYQKVLAKWDKLAIDIGEDEDKFAAVLKEQIYDKVDPNAL